MGARVRSAAGGVSGAPRRGEAGARLDWADIYRAFAGPGTGWRSPTPPHSFGQALAWLCRAKGVRVEVDGSSIYCLDCRLLA